MIPSKILVYRRPNGGIRAQTLQSARRRKKSCADLFQNGYRVRFGPGPAAEKEDLENQRFSLSTSLQFLSNWGKARGGQQPSGAAVLYSPLGSFSVAVPDSVYALHCTSLWMRASAE